MKYRIAIAGLLLVAGCKNKPGKPLYKDASLPVEQRVKDLLIRMTPEEKFWQLFMIPGDLEEAGPGQYKHGLFGFQVSAGSAQGGGVEQQMLDYNTSRENARTLAKKINSIQRYFVEETRLGIPLIFFDEALHGLVRDGATSFPQAIALAATFDTTLMRKVSLAIAAETKARGIRQILTPVVNLADDVRWGRTEETYGEDPFLTTEMGVTFVSSFEQNGIITTPKHFIANVGEGGRDSYPVSMSPAYLEQTHLIPFKACIERGGSRSVMTAYNSLDGEACTANDWLLNEKLKKEWGFTGFVISDAAATGGSFVLHHTSADYPESAAQAITNGLDVIFQTAHKHHELFDPPFYDGRINAGRIDDAVARVLRAKFELGLFDDPYVDENANMNFMHKPLARQAAASSLVLLKNEKNVLPLAANIKDIAVIGADAAEGRLGGYSGPGNGVVSVLQGLQERLGDQTTVHFAEGPGRKEHNWELVPGSMLWYHDGDSLRQGLQATVFDNINLEGHPLKTFIDQNVNKLWTLSRPVPELKQDYYSARWEGVIKPQQSGSFSIGLSGNDGYRMYINGVLVIDNWQKQSFHTKLVKYNAIKDQLINIRIEYFEPAGNGQLKLIWSRGDDREMKITKAVAAARKSQLAVIVAGIEEGEFRDRAMLALPGKQEELIKRVAATGVPVVVVLIGGSAITMNGWLNEVAGVLHAWYPGEEGGHAVAGVLLGDTEPSGRLPVTFPVHEAQLPLRYNHQPTGRGDDYINLSGRPLFPFGYGLSYTTFSYGDIRLSRNRIGVGDSASVSFTIRNTGIRDGVAVPQLYIKDDLASLSQPVIALKGFQRILLKAGESRELSFSITGDLLKMLNKEMTWVVEPGDFSIMIGASSTDIKLRTQLNVH